jgi:hypothetical protein
MILPDHRPPRRTNIEFRPDAQIVVEVKMLDELLN